MISFDYLRNSDQKEPNKDRPSALEQPNETLKKTAAAQTKDFTVAWISESIGISKKILYEWTDSDAEFTTALERLKDVQKDDPLKTGTEEDYFVNPIMIALRFFEVRDRH